MNWISLLLLCSYHLARLPWKELNLVYGISQGSVLCPHSFVSYTLPWWSFPCFCKIGYHINADKTQECLVYATTNLQSSLNNLNAAIWDVRSGFVNSKLKLTMTQ